mmetsp:Transcript_17003/g.21685  ORF Transcript_17003/g.21685 Transcript_17003/m.21685 type:complete len:215 (+) Transcript_17003:185-829(+)
MLYYMCRNISNLLRYIKLHSLCWRSIKTKNVLFVRKILSITSSFLCLVVITSIFPSSNCFWRCIWRCIRFNRSFSFAVAISFVHFLILLPSLAFFRMLAYILGGTFTPRMADQFRFTLVGLAIKTPNFEFTTFGTTVRISSCVSFWSWRRLSRTFDNWCMYLRLGDLFELLGIHKNLLPCSGLINTHSIKIFFVENLYQIDIIVACCFKHLDIF